MTPRQRLPGSEPDLRTYWMLQTEDIAYQVFDYFGGHLPLPVCYLAAAGWVSTDIAYKMAAAFTSRFWKALLLLGAIVLVAWFLHCLALRVASAEPSVDLAGPSLARMDTVSPDTGWSMFRIHAGVHAFSQDSGASALIAINPGSFEGILPLSADFSMVFVAAHGVGFGDPAAHSALPVQWVAEVEQADRTPPLPVASRRDLSSRMRSIPVDGVDIDVEVCRSDRAANKLRKRDVGRPARPTREVWVPRSGRR